MSHTETIPFQEQMARLKTRIEGNLSPRFVKIIHQAIRDLEQSDVHNQVLQVDDHAPEFALKDQKGQLVNSRDLHNQGPIVITFYRGFWCPYCNADMAHLNNFLGKIQDYGASLYAISPELPEYSQKIISMRKLGFDVLFDQGNQVADKFGIVFSLPTDLKELYRDNLHINLKMYNGDDDWKLPIPSRFLIDTQGIIRYADYSPDYTMRPDPEDLMKVLKNL